MSNPSSTSRPQKDTQPSRLPAIYVKPSQGTAEDVIDMDPGGSRRSSAQSEQIASFLEALAELVRGRPGDGPGSDLNRRQQAPPRSAGLSSGAPQTNDRQSSAEGDDPPEAFSSPFFYHLLRALRNLNYFVIIAPGRRGLIFLVHVPKRVIVLFLFALFLMFATIYGMPGIWEIMFGIIGIF